MRSRHGGLWFALACTATLLLSACASGDAATPSAAATAPAARVGTTVITQAELDVRLQSAITAVQQAGGPTAGAMVTQLRASVLRSLILDAVIAQEAADAGFAATRAQVQAEISKDARAVGGMPALQTQLAEAGGSIAQLEDEITAQLNEERLENAFARARAAEIEQQLAGGVSFAVVAKQMSDDTGTSATGGDLGTITQSNLASRDPAFSRAVETLAAGQYTQSPVREAGGYDVIEVYAKGSGWWKVRHIFVSAPNPYTVQGRPTWFAEALFATVAQLCTQNEIHVYISDAGANPCSGAPQLAPPVSPAG